MVAVRLGRSSCPATRALEGSFLLCHARLWRQHLHSTSCPTGCRMTIRPTRTIYHHALEVYTPFNLARPRPKHPNSVSPPLFILISSPAAPRLGFFTRAHGLAPLPITKRIFLSPVRNRGRVHSISQVFEIDIPFCLICTPVHIICLRLRQPGSLDPYLQPRACEQLLSTPLRPQTSTDHSSPQSFSPPPAK